MVDRYWWTEDGMDDFSNGEYVRYHDYAVAFAQATAFRNAFEMLHRQTNINNGSPIAQAEILASTAVHAIELHVRAHLNGDIP